MSPHVSFSDQVLREARSLGFDAAGIARAGPGVKLDRDFEAFQSFVRAGMYGEMQWLADPKRVAVSESLEGEGILRGARSIVCVARRYGPADLDAPETRDGFAPSQDEDSPVPVPGVVAGVARYARGRDYHRFMRRRIRRLASYLRSLGTVENPVRARPLCDEEPLLERAWAVRAGLGFVGKNGMLIVPGVGSMVLLGEVVTTLELDPTPPPSGSGEVDGRPDSRPSSMERCGACTRCLDACPTSAFVRPFVLDPRRCVSYLTIEHESAMDSSLRAGIGEHLFGCDDCQTVCPFNAGAGARAPLPRDDGDPFQPLERWSRIRLTDVLGMDEAAWKALSEGTPVRRAGKYGLARNAAIVLGNRGDEASLPALRAAASAHEDATVREAARWAIARIVASRAVV